MNNPCKIIGVLDNGTTGLTSTATTIISNADVVIGGTRVLELFTDTIAAKAERHNLSGQLTKVPDWINNAQDQNKQVVVLATGDPLCHGIANFLIKKMGVAACEVLPNVSMIQLACARLGLAWQNIKISSVHGKDAGEWQTGADNSHGLYPLLCDIKHNAYVATFTGPKNTPDRIARMLQLEGLANQYILSVAENILRPNERIIKNITVHDAARQTFAEPNVVIIQQTHTLPAPILFGIADSDFNQRKPDKGLITKREARAVSLARLQLRADSIVWDIGAGSGAMGLEAARLCPLGHVFAIEKNLDDYTIAESNRQKFAIRNYSLTHAKAPQGMDNWPDPDAVFIGGSGGELATLIEMCLKCLSKQGWLVMNFVTFENINTALEILKSYQGEWDITQLNAARSKPVLNMYRLAAENPIWIVSTQGGCYEP